MVIKFTAGLEDAGIPKFPVASASAALFTLGNNPVSGNSQGTFISMNALSGYTGDFILGQVNGSTVFNISARGFVLPSFGTTARDAISSPVAGQLIYNSDTAVLNIYTSSWGAISGGGGGAFTSSGGSTYLNTITDQVSIGTNTATWKLQVTPTSGITAGQTVLIQDATVSTGITTVRIKSGAAQSTNNIFEVTDNSNNPYFYITSTTMGLSGVIGINGAPSSNGTLTINAGSGVATSGICLKVGGTAWTAYVSDAYTSYPSFTLGTTTFGYWFWQGGYGNNIAANTFQSPSNDNGAIVLVTNGTASQTGNLFEARVNGTTKALINAAGGAVFGAATLAASAILQADSTTKGFLPPRMTTSQRTGISTPAEGLTVYDTDLHKLYCYDGTAWQACW